jgi:hypothetical protein
LCDHRRFVMLANVALLLSAMPLVGVGLTMAFC